MRLNRPGWTFVPEVSLRAPVLGRPVPVETEHVRESRLPTMSPFLSMNFPLVRPTGIDNAQCAEVKGPEAVFSLPVGPGSGLCQYLSGRIRLRPCLAYTAFLRAKR